jgi:hypothetical protein
LNFGFITLIPKNKGDDMIHLFIPIFLLNVFFKIFYKALSTHFDPAIDKIVLSCQTVSIKGRNIMDGVMTLQEILHKSRHKKTSGSGIQKIDLAYDKINWYFLFQCLELSGFNDTWCGWMKQVVVGGILCVRINHSLGRNFCTFKVVRECKKMFY